MREGANRCGPQERREHAAPERRADHAEEHRVNEDAERDGKADAHLEANLPRAGAFTLSSGLFGCERVATAEASAQDAKRSLAHVGALAGQDGGGARVGSGVRPGQVVR